MFPPEVWQMQSDHNRELSVVIETIETGWDLLWLRLLQERHERCIEDEAPDL